MKVQDNNSICFSWLLVNYKKKTNQLVSPSTNSVNSQNFLLEQGDYLLIPLTFSGLTKDYLIAFHSSKPILVKPEPVAKKHFQFHLQQSIVDNYCNVLTNHCNVIRKDLFEKVYIYEWGSGLFHLFMVENLSGYNIFFEIDALNSQGLISSRNTLQAQDMIFSNQRQIVLTLYSDPEIRAYSLSAKYHCGIVQEMPYLLHLPELTDSTPIYSPLQINTKW